MRIVFAGSPAVAVPTLDALLASPHQIVGVLTRPDAPKGRKHVVTPTPVAARAEEAGIPVIRASRPGEETTEAIAELRPDLGVIVAYGAVLREPLLSTPRLGWINLHFSLLPRWRGAAPVPHAILAGDAVTGVSVFQLVPELDAGLVYARLEEPIGRFDTNATLLRRLAELGAPLVVDTVDALDRGTAVGVPQHGEARPAGKLELDDGIIQWDRPAIEIDRLVRALTPAPDAPAPSATTRLDGERFKILEAAVAHEAPPLAPGVVVAVGKRVLVGTRDGALELLRVQPFSKPAMTAEAWFLAGRRGERTAFDA